MMPRKSKYIGKIFDNWKVVSRSKTVGNHYIYLLKTKKRLTVRTMRVRDNELTKFRKGKTVLEELAGKDYQLRKKVRINQNSIAKKVSLLNLFRRVENLK